MTDCQCPKCGRMHHKLANNPPPSVTGGLSHDDICLLSRTFTQHADININQPGHRINEWLKMQIAASQSS